MPLLEIVIVCPPLELMVFIFLLLIITPYYLQCLCFDSTMTEDTDSVGAWPTAHHRVLRPEYWTSCASSPCSAHARTPSLSVRSASAPQMSQSTSNYHKILDSQGFLKYTQLICEKIGLKDLKWRILILQTTTVYWKLTGSATTASAQQPASCRYTQRNTLTAMLCWEWVIREIPESTANPGARPHSQHWFPPLCGGWETPLLNRW